MIQILPAALGCVLFHLVAGDWLAGLVVAYWWMCWATLLEYGVPWLRSWRRRQLARRDFPTARTWRTP